MTVPVRKVKIAAGQTWVESSVWGETPAAYKVISAVTRGWPTTITAASHGIPAGVTIAVWIANARGPKINTTEDAPSFAQRVDDNTLTLMDVNTGGQAAYTANSATLKYLPVKDLTGYTARAQFRRTVTSTVLVDAVSTGADPEFVITAALGKIALTLTPAQTRALLDGGTAQTTGIAHVELVDANGVVYRAWDYNWTCTPEGTRES